jgi:hypothetical protein
MTGKTFTQLMEEGNSLGDVLQMLSNAAGGDAVAFANMWGSMEAGKGAVAIVNSGAEKFNETLGKMEHSAGAANSAFETMSGTSEYAFARMENSANNLSIALGDALSPMARAAAEVVSGLTDAITDFVQENPGAVRALTAVAIATGSVSAAIAAYTAATKIAAVAQAALNTAMAASPIGIMVTAIGALTIGIMGLTASAEDTINIEERLTSKSQELSDSIERQEGRVAYLSRRYGEYSDQAVSARVSLEEMREEFERTGETIGQMNARVDESIAKARESREAYSDTLKAINDESGASLVLAERLERLADSAEHSEEAQKLAQSMAERLSQRYPQLGLEYDNMTGKVNKSAEAIKKYAKEQAEAARQEAAGEHYIENLERQQELGDEIQEMNEQIAASEERLAQVVEERGGRTAGVYESDRGHVQALIEEEKALAEYIEEQRGRLDELQGTYSGVTGEIERYEASLNQAEEAARSAGESQAASAEAATAAVLSSIESQQAAWDSLNEEYASAIESARSTAESVNSTFSELKAEAQGTVDEIKAIWENHADYWTQYTDDIKKAQEAGLNPEVIAQFADGTEESAGRLHTLVTEYESIGEKAASAGASAQEAKEKQDEFAASVNEGYEEMQTSMDEWSAAAADVAIDYSGRADEIIGKTQAIVDGLKKDSEAKQAATAMMNAYITQLNAGIERAVAAARSGASRIAAALKTASATPGHAEGTTYAEPVYIAGEAGPELIVGREGSEVFPASETAKILSAIVQQRNEDRTKEGIGVPEGTTSIVIEKRNSTDTQNRNISITLNGKGRLDIGQSVSQGDLINYMHEELEGVIMSILSRQMYEEGNAAYEF